MYTIGVEEEFYLIDPETREMVPESEEVVSNSSEEVEPELQQSQVEIGTAVCETLEDVRQDLVRLRRQAAAAAAKAGLRIAATGTHPFSDWRKTEVFEKDAYVRLENSYQQLARESVVSGCHVHVGIDDREDAIQLMNRVRPWLPAVLALSVNSPFWLGERTGYCSYRNVMWQRFPLAGIPGTFRDRAEFDELVETLVAIEAIDDPARIYWDIRPSNKFDTLEFRVADACMDIDDAVLVAALVRALSETCHRQMKDGAPEPTVRDEVIRAAIWRAARYGIGERLIDPAGERSIPAFELITSLMEFVRPVLEDRLEFDQVQGLITQVRSRGTGAARQLAEYERTGSLEDVVDLILRETSPD